MLVLQERAGAVAAGCQTGVGLAAARNGGVAAVWWRTVLPYTLFFTYLDADVVGETQGWWCEECE